MRSIGHSPSTNVGFGQSMASVVVVLAGASVVVAVSPPGSPSSAELLQPAATRPSTAAATNPHALRFPMGGEGTGGEAVGEPETWFVVGR